MSKSKLLENAQIVPIIEPVDLTAGANTGDRVSLKNYRRCLFILAKGAGGTAGQDPTVTLQEHTAPSAGTSQNLAKIDHVYSKQAATNLAAVGQFSEVTQTAGATYTDGAAAEEAALWAIEVKDTDLSEGFGYVSINIADPGAGDPQIGAVIAILYEPRYGAKGADMPSAIS